MDPVVRIVAAALLAAVVGMDRELRGKPAGLRTTALVGAAAATFTHLSVEAFGDRADPSRVAADVVSGIGFLGAGAIFASGGRPRGLTTAASLWAAAAVGMAAGVDRMGIAVALSVTTAVLLIPLGALAEVVLRRWRTQPQRVMVVVDTPEGLEDIRRMLAEEEHNVREVELREVAGAVAADLLVVAHGDLDPTVERLRDLAGVRFITSSEREGDAG